MAIIIRNILKKDVPALTKLLIKIYEKKPYALNFSKAPEKTELLSLLSYKCILAKKKLIVDKVAVDSKNNILGECEVIKSNSDIHSKTGIIGIIIDEKARRKGVGTLLLSTSIKESKKINIEKILSIVSIKNIEAINFFKKNNFIIINLKKANEEGKVVFELNL